MHVCAHGHMGDGGDVGVGLWGGCHRINFKLLTFKIIYMFHVLSGKAF